VATLDEALNSVPRVSGLSVLTAGAGAPGTRARDGRPPAPRALAPRRPPAPPAEESPPAVPAAPAPAPDPPAAAPAPVSPAPSAPTPPPAPSVPSTPDRVLPSVHSAPSRSALPVPDPPPSSTRSTVPRPSRHRPRAQRSPQPHRPRPRRARPSLRRTILPRGHRRGDHALHRRWNRHRRQRRHRDPRRGGSRCRDVGARREIRVAHLGLCCESAAEEAKRTDASGDRALVLPCPVVLPNLPPAPMQSADTPAA
jgi:hypothetical protein